MAGKRGKWNPAHHPRDSKGRFTRSATRVMNAGDRGRARKGLTGFSPTLVNSAESAATFLDRNASPAPESGSAMAEYLAGGWRETNATLRAQRDTPPGVEDIDAEFAPSDQDLMLRRQVPLSMFAHIPMEQLVGMKVRDAAYGSAQLDHPDHGPSAPDAVTLHLATPAGTPLYVNAKDGEILYARDTEAAITRAEPNGQGGWDLYGVIIPRKDAPARSDQDGRPDQAGGEPALAEPEGQPAATGPAAEPAPAATTPAAGGQATPVGTAPVEPDTAPPAAADRDTAVKDAIQDAFDQATAGLTHKPRWVMLADIRAALPADYTRAEVDKALLDLELSGEASVTPESNQKMLTQAHRDAALSVGNQLNHLVTFDFGDRTPTARPAGQAAAPAQAPGDAQLDLAGGEVPFEPVARSAIGLPERLQVGRERAIAATQQLGLFASDEREMEGQMGMLDALLAMPPADPPPATTAAPTVAASASTVPDDLTGWSDEQLSALFGELSAADQLDEAGLGRVAGEWERREQAMRDLVAQVPDEAGLAALDEDAVMRLYADLTANPGTMDSDAASRVEADLDRRTAAQQADTAYQAEVATKRAYLARDLGAMGDDELGTAAGYAADLGDEAEIQRVYTAWEAKEQRDAQAAAAEQATAEQRRVEAEQAAQQATTRVAEQAAAAEVAQAEPEADFLTQFLADVGVDLGALNNQSAALDAADTADQADLADFRARSEAVNADLVAEFTGQSDQQLAETFTRFWFASEAAGKDRARRARQEQTRRQSVALHEQARAEDRRERRRLLGERVEELTDDELSKFPALLAAMPGPEAERLRTERLPQIRAEVDRRAAQLDRVAAEKAAGPAGPARYTNPLDRLRTVEMWATYQMSGGRGADAGRRLAAAKRRVLGLPDDAADTAVRDAERADPRSLPDRAALYLAWYRHLGQYDDLGDTPADWSRGYPDEDIPPTPNPQPAANIAQAAKVWQQIQQTARQDLADGRPETGARFLRAIARAYRIPDQTDPSDPAAMQRLQGEVSAAIRADPRTENQRAAGFVAELRVLAALDGVDPDDATRYGPPDRGGKRTPRGVWRSATADEQIRIDRLVARGWDPLDAYADVLGLDVDRLRQDQAATAAAGGVAGGSTVAKLRQAYDEYVDLQYLAAERGTVGHLLSPAGKAKGINPRSLFSGGFVKARAYASEELLRWWGGRPRLTFADYKAQATGQGRAAREAQLAGQKGNEFL